MEPKIDSGNQVQAEVLSFSTLQDKDGHVLAKGKARVRDVPRLHGSFYPKPGVFLDDLREKASFLDTAKNRYRVLNFVRCSACSVTLHYEFDLEPVSRLH